MGLKRETLQLRWRYGPLVATLRDQMSCHRDADLTPRELWVEIWFMSQ